MVSFEQYRLKGRSLKKHERVYDYVTHVIESPYTEFIDKHLRAADEAFHDSKAALNTKRIDATEIEKRQLKVNEEFNEALTYAKLKINYYLQHRLNKTEQEIREEEPLINQAAFYSVLERYSHVNYTHVKDFLGKLNENHLYFPSLVVASRQQPSFLQRQLTLMRLLNIPHLQEDFRKHFQLVKT